MFQEVVWVFRYSNVNFIRLPCLKSTLKSTFFFHMYLFFCYYVCYFFLFHCVCKDLTAIPYLLTKKRQNKTKNGSPMRRKKEKKGKKRHKDTHFLFHIFIFHTVIFCLVDTTASIRAMIEWIDPSYTQDMV